MVRAARRRRPCSAAAGAGAVREQQSWASRNKSRLVPVFSADRTLVRARSLTQRRNAPMRLKNTSGAALATAAAILFGTGFVSTAVAGSDAKIHCGGVNACKGQSACKSAKNDCKGQNACKGKGFLEMTQEECKDAQERAGDLLKGK